MKFFGENFRELDALIRSAPLSSELLDSIQLLALRMAVSTLEFPEDIWKPCDFDGEPIPGGQFRARNLEGDELPDTDIATGDICPLPPSSYGLDLEEWPSEWSQWERSEAIGGASDGEIVLQWVAAKEFAQWVAWRVQYGLAAAPSPELLAEWAKVKRWRYSAGRDR